MSTNGSGTAVVKFNPAKFKAVIANMAKGAAPRVGYLKFGKDGSWSYGADEITPEGNAFVDPEGFVQGWQCWADTDLPGVSSALLDSVIVPMDQAMPDRPVKVPETGREWSQMLGMSLILDGERLTFSATSVGGRNAMAALAEAYYSQYSKDPDGPAIAEVELLSDSYKHKNKTYGKIYTPIFNVVKWHAKFPMEEAPGAKAPVAAKRVGVAKKLPAAKKAAKGRK
jgi:hypothetical protein